MISLPPAKQLEAYNNLQNYYLVKYTTPNSLIDVITQDSGLAKEYGDKEYAQLFQDIEGYLNPVYGDQKIKEQLDQWSKTAGFSVAQNLVSKGCKDFSRFTNNK